MDKSFPNTRSTITAALSQIPKWDEFVKLGVIDQEETIEYLVEFPQNIEQIKLLPGWFSGKSGNEQVRGFINFLLAFPDGSPSDEDAFGSLFGGGNFRLANIYSIGGNTGLSAPAFVTYMCDDFLPRLVLSQLNGLYFWTQAKYAIAEIINANSALEEFTININKYTFKVGDERLFEILAEQSKRDHVYQGILPWKSDLFQSTFKHLREERHTNFKKLLSI